jgi:hypothetical protein
VFIAGIIGNLCEAADAGLFAGSDDPFCAEKRPVQGLGIVGISGVETVYVHMRRFVDEPPAAERNPDMRDTLRPFRRGAGPEEEKVSRLEVHLPGGIDGISDVDLLAGISRQEDAIEEIDCLGVP